MRPIPSRAAIRIDPVHATGHPLSKERIAVYNSGLVPIERYRRDARWIAETAPESLRIDLGWGAEWMPWTREVVEVDPQGRLSFDFRETDDIARLLTAAGTRPYWSYCYVPTAARPEGGDWRTMATDDSRWVSTVRAYVAGMRERQVGVGYHEVYNEPDLRDERTGEAAFYTGGLEDYLELYRATATAVRESDPTARVGGPALAVTAAHADWLEAFCRMVVAERLPLDFLSFHHYGHFGLESTLRIVREAVARHRELRHVELHLNEYNAFSIDYPRHGLQDTHLLAATFAAELPRLLAQRDLTRTHWAQYLDSGEGNFSGMIDIEGRPKPVHAVYEFYQRMPIDRVHCVVDGPPGVGAIASSDGAATAAIVWNRHFAPVEIDLELPVAASLTIVRIDGDGVSAPSPLPHSNGRAGLALPPGGVALLMAGELQERPTVRRSWGIPVTPAVPGWSDLDEATATFRFGTGGAGWVTHGADLLDGEAIEDWRVFARTPQGDPVPVDVVVRVEEGNSLRARTIAGSPDGPEPELPDRPRPSGSVRVFVSASAPAGCLVTVSPDDGRHP
jgi:hypothetical protein